MLAIVTALGLSGCSTSKTAEYVDPKTGHRYLCYRQSALGVIPSIAAGNSYADCKNVFEERGFQRLNAPPPGSEPVSTPPATRIYAPPPVYVPPPK